jgi:hypothetical protein
VIAQPLVAPHRAAAPRVPQGRGWGIVAAVLFFAAALGAVVWVLALTPVGFSRFRLVDGDRIENYRTTGTFVVFEERNGAGDPLLPPPITVSVTSDQGDVIQVEQLMKPYQRTSPYVYATPWQQGRAIARFTISEPGSYYVRSLGVGGSSSSGYGPRRGGTLAIGRELATTWIGGPGGVALLAGLPLALGVVAVVVGRRRRRTVAASVPGVGVDRSPGPFSETGPREAVG